MQTTRIATRFLQEEFSFPELALHAAEKMEKRCTELEIKFLSLGSTSPANSNEFLKNDFISRMATTLKFTSFTLAWQPDWDFHHATLLAEEIFKIAELSNGEANFRFAVSFNCKPGIPFFPAAEAPPNEDKKVIASFAIGTENSALLYKAMSSITPDCPENTGVDTAVEREINRLFTKALTPIDHIAREIELSSSKRIQMNYIGIDTSIAPGLEDNTTIPAAFEKLPFLEKFGDTGTLAITAGITRALKGLSVKKTGYCGLMLPVCEDKGLAKAVDNGTLSIQQLLQYSAVCGVGLDTVPVPGPGPNTTPEERRSLVVKAAAVLLDVAALSQRLGGKQLTVRLLPVIKAVAGEKTRFTSPYLIDSTVMNL